ncbi:MAG: hypothetical protein ACFB20_01520 [Opitutales bacterium]
MRRIQTFRTQWAAGFTLSEVILATGILGVAVLALVGLMGPTLQRVETVVDTSRLVNATAKVDAFVDDFVASEEPGEGFKEFYDMFGSDTTMVPIYVWDEPLDLGAASSSDAQSLSDVIDYETRVTMDFTEVPLDRNEIIGPIFVYALSRGGTGFQDDWPADSALAAGFVLRAEVHEVAGNPPIAFAPGSGTYDERTFRQVLPMVINR